MKSWIKLCAIALAMFAAGVSAQTSPPHPPKPPFPQIDLPQRARGAQAIQLLGARLPEVAAWYGKSPEEFASILRRDRLAIIDRKGRMLYEEEIEPPTGSAGSPTSTGLLVPLDQTLKLHSRPGAKRTIYLNFVGATLTNTVWNSSGGSITALPFDFDGVPYSFSAAELERIQYIWQRVAEDYAPFDVNVTTEPPAAGALTRSSSTDDTFGTTVLITQNTFYGCSGCGGVAYVGVFDDTSDYRKPALVFYSALGGGNEKYVAEAISHEAGHNMGLNHDGYSGGGYYYGHNGWAPIMGVGYNQSLVQWSKGEYSTATNKEDDFAVMASNGLPLRSDDHANSTGSATRLGGTTANGMTTLSGAGIVERAGDVDVFSFVAGPGTLNIAVNPAARSANVDVSAELLNANGQVITSSNPLDGLGATLTANASVGGTYFVAVRGSGKGDLSTGYSSYGSVGEYSVAGTVPATASQAPIVAMSATPTSGTVALPVSFNASGSYDPDGSVVSIEWNFGDGSPLAYGTTASRTYTSPGSYTATVKVTDNAGLTSVKSVTITALAGTTSQPPVAVASATPTSGPVALPVSFTSNGTYDPDGNVASYEWNFGNGYSASGANASHTYTTPGIYTATLKVTDNAGLTSTKSVTINATSSTSVTNNSTLSVSGVRVTLSSNKGGQTQATASVSVKDGSGNSVAGASVAGSWSGVVSGSGSGTTNTSGTASISSSRTKSPGTFMFTVTGVTYNGYTYVPSNTTTGSATR